MKVMCLFDPCMHPLHLQMYLIRRHLGRCILYSSDFAYTRVRDVLGHLNLSYLMILE